MAMAQGPGIGTFTIPVPQDQPTSYVLGLSSSGLVLVGNSYQWPATELYNINNSGPAGGVNLLNWVSPKSSLPNTDLEFYGINSSSQLVGYFTSNTTDSSKAYPYFEDGNYLEHALFTTPGGAVIDLNDMISANSGWTLLTATGINDQAQIVGYGINPSGALQAYELTPSTVPEPTTLAIFAVMGCACGYRIISRRRVRGT